MRGSRYSVAVSQLEDPGELHPDAYMFFMQTIPDEKPEVIAVIMTQLSLKAVFK